jgi:hypothetical protein
MAKGKSRARCPTARPRRSRGRRGGGASTGAVTTKHELGLQVVDFFDYEYGDAGSATEGGIKHYYWDTNQNLFNNNTSGASGQEQSFCRVRKVEVYVLPRVNAQTAAISFNNADAMYTANVQTPALSTGAQLGVSVQPLAVNTQVTNILPQIDTFWKKVYECNMQKTFQSSVITPYYFNNLQCLFSLRLIDPPTGTALGGIGNSLVKVRCKVVLHIDQPIMPIQNVNKTILSNNDMGNPTLAANGTSPSASSEYAQIDLKSRLDLMR